MEAALFAALRRSKIMSKRLTLAATWAGGSLEGKITAYDPASGYFKRAARVEGYVLMDGLLWWDFNAPMTHPQAGTHGYNFSDQWPGY
jgi:hypothetical protein